MSTFRFSRRTVLASIEVLDVHLSQAQLSRFLLELGQLPMTIRGEGVSAKKRLNDLMEMADAFPDHRLETGALLRDAITDKAIALAPLPQPLQPWETVPTVRPETAGLIRALELDGFRLTENGLQRTLPAEFKVPEAENELILLLDKHGLTVAKGHLMQALDAHARGNWASANAMLRSFFDALLDELAVRLDPSAAEAGSGQGRRAKLAKAGFLIEELNEWDNDGKGFINGLVRRLNPHGSHPGLSDEEDSAFRIHILLLTTRLLLVRFDRRQPA